MQPETNGDPVEAPDTGITGQGQSNGRQFHRICLPAHLSHAEIEQLQSDVISARNDGQSIQFDGVDVDRVSTLGVQFLLSVDRDLAKSGLHMSVANVSAELRGHFRING